ncbi:hypothetical protein VTK56DRAFT_4057 [Thermocarpiscus australiensis]
MGHGGIDEFVPRPNALRGYALFTRLPLGLLLGVVSFRSVVFSSLILIPGPDRRRSKLPIFSVIHLSSAAGTVKCLHTSSPCRPDTPHHICLPLIQNHRGQPQTATLPAARTTCASISSHIPEPGHTSRGYGPTPPTCPIANHLASAGYRGQQQQQSSTAQL